MGSEADEFYRIPLTSAEALATLTAVKAIRSLLRPEADSTFAPGILESVIERISDELPEFFHGASERLAATLAENLSESDSHDHLRLLRGAPDPPFPPGPTRTKLLEAQEQGKAVEIEYYVQSRNEWNRRTVDIEKVYVNGDTWLLSGHCRLRDEFRVFRIENIRSVSLIEGGSFATALEN